MREIFSKRFDKIAAPAPRIASPRLIGTADAIGARIGRSADVVRRTLSKLLGTPVRRITA